jgi:hypothetical protein
VGGDGIDCGEARVFEGVEGARVGKGWTVAGEHVYVDDGVSGAEFGERRPGSRSVRKGSACGASPAG